MASTTFPVTTSAVLPGVVVWLWGEHDASTVDSLQTTLDRATAANDGDLVVDLSGVEFMGAAAVGVLVGTRARLAAQARSLRLRSPSRHVARILQVCGTLVDPA
jgi:anti-anti-sigma factor